MKKILILVVLSLLFVGQTYSQTKQNLKGGSMKELETEHYTFKLNDKVTRQKVNFKNRYGIYLTGDLYSPNNRGNESLPALVISRPFGAVKEQSSGLYSNQMAERGFIAIAFDQFFQEYLNTESQAKKRVFKESK